MIVYVESNFVLEIALARETEAQAQALLESAERRELELVIPVFSLCEPYGTVRYRAEKRNREFKIVQKHLDDLGRGEAHRDLVDVMGPRVQDIVEVAVRERDVLEQIVERVLQCASVLPFSVEAFDAAKDAQSNHGLDPSDALIYSAVLLDARGRPRDEPKTFITRNRNDFDRQSIREELDAAGCTLRITFELE